MARAIAFTVGKHGATDLAKAVAVEVGEAVLGVELSLRGPAAVYVRQQDASGISDRALDDGQVILVVHADEGKPGVFILDSLEVR